MRNNKNDFDNIVFDRDTSIPKSKMKNFKVFKRPQKQENLSNEIDRLLNPDKFAQEKNEETEKKSNNLIGKKRMSKSNLKRKLIMI